MKRTYAVIVIIVVVAIAAIAGSARLNRDVVYDETVQQDLYSLSDSVQTYARENRRMPASLALVKLNPEVEARVGQYSYSPIDAHVFELCGTYRTDTKKAHESSYESSYSLPNYHSRGRVCTKLRVEYLEMNGLGSPATIVN